VAGLHQRNLARLVSEALRMAQLAAGWRVDKVMTVREVAQFPRVHQTTVYRLLRTDEIPAFKVESDWRFSRQAIEAWIKKNTDFNG